MPAGVCARKIVIYNRIGRLRGEERKRAGKLYNILDEIEWLTVTPFYLGQFALLALVFVPSLVSLVNRLPGGGGMMLLYSLASAAVFYLASVFILKKLVFNIFRSNKVEKLRTMLFSDYKYRGTLERLKKIDPDMARNIRKCIAQATYGA